MKAGDMDIDKALLVINDGINDAEELAGVLERMVIDGPATTHEQQEGEIPPWAYTRTQMVVRSLRRLCRECQPLAEDLEGHVSLLRRRLREATAKTAGAPEGAETARVAD